MPGAPRPSNLQTWFDGRTHCEYRLQSTHMNKITQFAPEFGYACVDTFVPWSRYINVAYQLQDVNCDGQRDGGFNCTCSGESTSTSM